MQRHDGGMVEILPAHAAAAQRHRVLARARGYGGRHLAVVLHGHGRVPCAEAPHVAAVEVARGQMEAVAEQRGVGRHHDDCLGRVGSDAARHLAIRVEGVLDGALLAPAYLGHGEGRMRPGVRGDDSHESSFPQASTGRSNVRTCAPFNGSIVHPANSRSCPLPPHAPIRYASVDGRAHRRAYRSARAASFTSMVMVWKRCSM